VSGDPRLDVERSQRLLRINERRLDLDDEQHELNRVPRDQVDPSTVPVVVEADLTPDIPSIGRQTGGTVGAQLRVVGVEEPIDLYSLPPDVPRQGQIDGASDRSGSSHRQASDLAALEQAAHPLTDSSSRCQVLEAPSTLVASRAHGHTQPPVIHDADGGRLGLTGRLLAELRLSTCG
jgi:hypothetical protein